MPENPSPPFNLYDEYMRQAAEATNDQDRENYLQRARRVSRYAEGQEQEAEETSTFSPEPLRVIIPVDRPGRRGIAQLDISGFQTNGSVYPRFDFDDDETVPSGQPEPPAPPAPPQTLPHDHLRRLEEATRRVHISAQSIPEDVPPRAPREAQYIDIIRQSLSRDMRYDDIVGSELPFAWQHLTPAAQRSIANSALCRGVQIHRSGESSRYVLSCVSCGIESPAPYAFICGGALWCAEHVPDINACGKCGGIFTDAQPVLTFDGREIMACTSCINRTKRGCPRCGKPITVAQVETLQCDDCLDAEVERDDPWRDFSMSLKWVSDDLGEIIKSKRLFSAEFEVIVSTDTRVSLLSRKVPPQCGITTDASIDCRDEGQGVEIPTPRCAGKKGENLIHRVGAGLKDVHATVNRSCGLHIHLDGRGIIHARRKTYPTALIQLWKTYLVFEDVMQSLIPFNRRRNDYCRPLGETFKLIEIEECRSIFDLEKLWYKRSSFYDIRSEKQHRYHSSRYFGVNLHSLLGKGHLEIRYHPGTMNPKKVLEWVNLHSLIMDACAKKALTYDFIREAQATSSMKEKTDLLFARIGLAESSKQYFRSRQRKFSRKTNDESEI